MHLAVVQFVQNISSFSDTATELSVDDVVDILANNRGYHKKLSYPLLILYKLQKVDNE